jgi:hypothetical protein
LILQLAAFAFCSTFGVGAIAPKSKIVASLGAPRLILTLIISASNPRFAIFHLRTRRKIVFRAVLATSRPAQV